MVTHGYVFKLDRNITKNMTIVLNINTPSILYSLIYFSGVMKAGTEAFSKFLMLHPMIVMQRDMPSTLFFTTNFGKDLQWYRQQVSDASMKTTSTSIYMCLLTCEKCGQKAGGCGRVREGRCVSRIMSISKMETLKRPLNY